MKVDAAAKGGAQVVQAARGWIGTRFHHQGRLRQAPGEPGGCDCLGLLVGVAKELDLRGRDGRPLHAYDETHYGHMPDGARLRVVLNKLLIAIEPQDVAEGDVLLMRFEREPQHLAIVSAHPQGGLGIIHALAAARKVVEHRLDELWLGRIVQAYRLP